MTRASNSPARKTPLLLIVEDSDEDFEALKRCLGRSPTVVPIQRCVNGEQALAFLYRTGSYADLERAPRPGLIVLDLNLPGTDGRAVLSQIKQDKSLKTIPVIVFTTSNNPKDIEDCYRYGANSYIIKPMDFAKLKQAIQTVVDYWFQVTTLSDHMEK